MPLRPSGLRRTQSVSSFARSTFSRKRTAVRGKFGAFKDVWRFIGPLEIGKSQTQNRLLPKNVIPNARSFAGDLEPRFLDHRHNSLKQSGFQLALRKGYAWLE